MTKSGHTDTGWKPNQRVSTETRTVQVVERRRAGAGEDDPLFVHPRTGGRYVGSALRNVLRSVGAKTGISVGVRDSLGSPSGPGAWLRVRGMDIIRLDPVPAATR